MGSFLQGFVGGVSDSVTQQLQQKHQEDQDAKKQHRDYLEKVIFDQSGTFSPQEKQKAVDEYTKASGPQAKKFLSQNAPVMQMIHKLGGAFSRGGQQGQQQPGAQGGPVSPPAPGTFQPPAAQAKGSYDTTGEWVPDPTAAAGGGMTATVPPSAFGSPPDATAAGAGGAAGTPTAKQRFNATPPFFQQPGMTAPGSSADTTQPPTKKGGRVKQRFNATPPPTPLHVETYEEKEARRVAELQKAHELETQWGKESDVYKEQEKARAAQEQYNRGLDEIAEMERRGIKLTDSQKAEILTGGKITAAPVPKAIDPKVHTATWKDAQGKEQTRSIVWDPEEGPRGDWVSATTHKKLDIPEDASIAVAPTRAAGGAIRSVPHAVSVGDAAALQQGGASYKDQEGNELDLSKVPPDMGLQAMVQGDRMFYVPVTPNQRTVDVGGVRFGVTPWEIKSIAQGGGTPLGAAQIGGSTQGQQIVQTPQGPVAVGGTRTPAITGPNPNILGPRGAQPTPTQPTPAQPPPPPPGPGGQPPAQPGPPAPRPSGAPRAQTAPAAPPQGGGVRGPVMQGVPQGMYNAQSQQLTPGLVAINQIFGSRPDDPNSFMSIAAPRLDDPHSRKYMGAAWRFIMKGMNAEAESGGGHINAGGILGVSIGNLLNWVSNEANIPKMLSESEQAEYAAVFKELTPQERRALNAQINAMSNIAGMRKLSGNIATEASMDALRNDVPTVGELAHSKEEFYDKLSSLAREARTGTSTILPGVWPTGPGAVTKQWVDGLEDYVLNKASGKSAPPQQKAPPANQPQKPQVKILNATPIQ